MVTSLWNINDTTAPAIMADFYLHLAAGKGRARALRKAMQTVRANPQSDGPSLLLAPFILVGAG